MATLLGIIETEVVESAEVIVSTKPCISKGCYFSHLLPRFICCGTDDLAI